MPLFTFVLDFRGGTYVSQTRSQTVESASQKWTRELNTNNITGMGPFVRQKLIVELDNEKPTPLNRLKSAWCISVSTPKGLALINIIETTG